MEQEKSESVLGYISRTVTKLHRQTADLLNRKTAGWSPGMIKAVLVIFCLATGNASLFIAGKAILSANGPPKELKMPKLQIPFITIQKPPGKMPVKTDTILNKDNH